MAKILVVEFEDRTRIKLQTKWRQDRTYRILVPWCPKPDGEDPLPSLAVAPALQKHALPLPVAEAAVDSPVAVGFAD